MKKRILDIGISLLLLIVLFPVGLVLFFVVSFAYRGKGIFFIQERIGREGAPFRLYKFRTLRATYSSLGHTDDDVTIFGRFLRKYSLDELPQLFNVIKGEMSLVGPRPLPIEYRQWIESEYPWRMAIKPGITGSVQTKGRNFLSWEERFSLDREYFESQSLHIDLKIIFSTVRVLLRGDGDITSPILKTGPC